MKKLVIILLALSVALITACGSVTETTTGAETKTAKISKAEFDQIKDGMSYEEVVKIVGGEGEVQAESGKPGEELHTVSYMYKGEKGSIGANANLMFQDGKMIMKAQAGLK